MSTRYIYKYYNIAPKLVENPVESDSTFRSYGFYYNQSSRAFRSKVSFIDNMPTGYTTEENGKLNAKGEVSVPSGTYFKPSVPGADIVDLQWDGSDTGSAGKTLLYDAGDPSAQNYHHMLGRYMVIQSIEAASGTTLATKGFSPPFYPTNMDSDQARGTYGVIIYIPPDLRRFSVSARTSSTFFGIYLNFSAKDSFSNALIWYYYDKGKGTSLQKTASRSEKYTSDSTVVVSGGIEYWREYAGSDSIDPLSVTCSKESLRPGDTVSVSVTPRSNTYGGTISYLYQYQLNGGAWTDIQTTTATSNGSATFGGLCGLCHP